MSAPIQTFFNTVERRSLLLQIARAWDRTPFFPNSEAPGPNGGVDCVHLLHAVYYTAGVIPFITIPPQVMDHGQNSDRSVLVEAFETWPALRANFRRLPECNIETALPGDALLFRAGKVPHHTGVMLIGNEFFHVIEERGAHRVRAKAIIRGERIVGRLEAIYRPLPEPC